MVKLSASNPSPRISGQPTYSAPGPISDLSQSRALTGKLTKQHVLMVQETREPTGYPRRQGGVHAMSNGSPQSGFESRAFLLGGNSANHYSIIYSRTSPVTGITCWHCTFSTKQRLPWICTLTFLCTFQTTCLCADFHVRRRRGRWFSSPTGKT